MLYYDNEARMQQAREHADELAREMRRVRRLTGEDAGYSRWARLAAELLGRTERLRHGRGYHAPAYDS
jgi:hypothetical protein